MLDSGISLNQALQILIESDKETEIKKYLRDTQRLLQSGMNAAYSMEKSGLVVNPLYQQLILIGEQTGKLNQSFMFIADAVEERRQFISKIVQATTYPLIVISVALISLIILIAFVVPSFAEVFKSMNAELPFITIMILGIHNFFADYWYFVFMFIFLLIIILRSGSKSRKLKKVFDSWSFRFPIVGEIFHLKINYEFCTNLSLLLSSGIPMLKGMQLLAKNSSSFVFSRQLEYLCIGLENGERLSALISKGSVISPIVQQMITVGEETAEMPRLLGNTAELFKLELNSKVGTFGTLIEPIMIIVLGVVVGLILISMYLPLFDSMNSIGVN